MNRLSARFAIAGAVAVTAVGLTAAPASAAGSANNIRQISIAVQTVAKIGPGTIALPPVNNATGHNVWNGNVVLDVSTAKISLTNAVITGLVPEPTQGTTPPPPPPPRQREAGSVSVSEKQI